MEDGSHLLVQAGTGTGKSLGYLVPALLQHLRRGEETQRVQREHGQVSRSGVELQRHFAVAPNKLQAAQDAMWVLFNTKEFLFNH